MEGRVARRLVVRVLGGELVGPVDPVALLEERAPGPVDAVLPDVGRDLVAHVRAALGPGRPGVERGGLRRVDGARERGRGRRCRRARGERRERLDQRPPVALAGPAIAQGAVRDDGEDEGAEAREDRPVVDQADRVVLREGVAVVVALVVEEAVDDGADLALGAQRHEVVGERLRDAREVGRVADADGHVLVALREVLGRVVEEPPEPVRVGPRAVDALGVVAHERPRVGDGVAVAALERLDHGRVAAAVRDEVQVRVRVALAEPVEVGRVLLRAELLAALPRAFLDRRVGVLRLRGHEQRRELRRVQRDGHQRKKREARAQHAPLARLRRVAPGLRERRPGEPRRVDVVLPQPAPREARRLLEVGAARRGRRLEEPERRRRRDEEHDEDRRPEVRLERREGEGVRVELLRGRLPLDGQADADAAHERRRHAALR